MNPVVKLVLSATALAMAPLLATGQEESPTKTTPGAGDELHALRQAVEAQSKQIESLRQAVTQLSEKLGAKEAPAAATPVTPPAPAATPPPPSENSAATPSGGIPSTTGTGAEATHGDNGS